MGVSGMMTAADAMASSVAVAAVAAAAARDAGSGRTARASTSGRGAKKSGADARDAKGVSVVGGDRGVADDAVHATAHGVGHDVASAAAVAVKPPRKPYTMTKARVSWTTKEHAKFLKALQLYDRDWKKIESYVETKTVIQIRSHAQKYFLKVMKDGTGEHVPPPRRKAKNNESDKAKKKAEVTAAASKSAKVGESTSVPPTVETTAPLAAVQIPPVETSPVAAPAKKVVAKPPSKKKVTAKPAAKASTKRKRSDMAAPRPPRRAPVKTTKQSSASAIKSPFLSNNNNNNNNNGSSDGAAPDFMVIYSFLAGLFADDASTNGNHVTYLQRMSPINRETTVLLMRNVCSNLHSKQMWNQQLQLVGAGCTTFLNPEDAQYYIESIAPKMQDQKHAGMQRSDSDTTKEKNSGDGSGGGSNDAPQQEAQQRFKLTLAVKT